MGQIKLPKRMNLKTKRRRLKVCVHQLSPNCMLLVVLVACLVECLLACLVACLVVCLEECLVVICQEVLDLLVVAQLLKKLINPTEYVDIELKYLELINNHKVL